MKPEDTRWRAGCVDRGHPPVTYNPLMNRTWCACGEVTVDGHPAISHWTCCERAGR